MKKFAIISDPHLGMTGSDGSGFYSLLSRPEVAPEANRPAMVAKQDALLSHRADLSQRDSLATPPTGRPNSGRSAAMLARWSRLATASPQSQRT